MSQSDVLEPSTSKTCRACLGNVEEMRSLYGACLDMMLMAVANVQVERFDGLPESICVQCVWQVSQAFKFRQMCKQSDNLLRKLDRKKKLSTTISEDEKEIEEDEESSCNYNRQPQYSTRPYQDLFDGNKESLSKMQSVPRITLSDPRTLEKSHSVSKSADESNITSDVNHSEAEPLDRKDIIEKIPMFDEPKFETNNSDPHEVDRDVKPVLGHFNSPSTHETSYENDQEELVSNPLNQNIQNQNYASRSKELPDSNAKKNACSSCDCSNHPSHPSTNSPRSRSPSPQIQSELHSESTSESKDPRRGTRGNYKRTTHHDRELFFMLYNSGKSIAESAELTGINANSAKSMLHRYHRNGGEYVPGNCGGRRHVKLTPAILTQIEQIYAENPSVTLKVIQGKLVEILGVNLCLSTIRNGLKTLRLSSNRTYHRRNPNAIMLDDIHFPQNASSTLLKQKR